MGTSKYSKNPSICKNMVVLFKKKNSNMSNKSENMADGSNRKKVIQN